MYNYYNEKPLFDQNLVACNHSNSQPLMFPDEMFCNENPTWSSIVIANIVFASFGIVLSTVLIFICFDSESIYKSYARLPCSLISVWV